MIRERTTAITRKLLLAIAGWLLLTTAPAAPTKPAQPAKPAAH